MDTSPIPNIPTSPALASYGTAGLFVSFVVSLLAHYGVTVTLPEAIGAAAGLGHLVHYLFSLGVFPTPASVKAKREAKAAAAAPTPTPATGA